MKRLFTSLSTLSLLLFAAVVVMWVRSYFRDDTYGWCTDREAGNYLHVTSGKGGVGLCLTEGNTPSDMLEGFRSVSISDWAHPGLLGVVVNYDARRLPRGVLGFRTYHAGRDVFSARTRFAGLPYWFLFVATALVPAVAALRWRRQWHRRLRRLCPSCDYDLRASPDRCPECGAVPQPREARPSS